MVDFDTFISHFHFLRPWWLLGIILLPFLLILTRRFLQVSSWTLVIEPRLLKYLLEDDLEGSRRWPAYLLLTALLLALIALAGPTWQKLPQPVHKEEDALVIILDLSLSMLATDVKPSRLITAQFKLIDILNRRKSGQTALVAYAGAAHTVSPLTDDTETIKALVSSLSPLIMPAMGSRIDTAAELASQLLKDAGVSHGRILLITDGVEIRRINAVTNHLTGHALSILAIGTEDGGPIPLPNEGFLKHQDAIVIAKLELAPLQTLAQANYARLTLVVPSDQDIDYLLKPDAFDLNLNLTSREVERQFDQWREMGPWLILFILPLAALAFRRGWLLGILFLVLIQPPPAYAENQSTLWQDLWTTRDQQGQKAFSQGRYSEAAELFKSLLWKGSSAYKAGDFNNAAKAFAKINSPEAHYNRGNALAKSGQLDEAIAAYNKALELDPELVDAQVNKALIDQLIKQQEQEQQLKDQKKNQQQQQQQNSSAGQSQSDQTGAHQSSDNNEQPNQSNPENKNPTPGSGSPDQSGQTNEQPDGSGETGDQAEINQEGQEGQEGKEQAKQKSAEAKDFQEQVQALKKPSLSEEQRQAAEQWLRRIPDDPGGLLKRKFDYQFQQRQSDRQFLPEQDDNTLW